MFIRTPMGKRQVRIFRKDLQGRAMELLQRPSVQVITRSKIVLHGVLKELSPEILQLQDPRLHLHTLPLEQIEEVIYDIEAPY